MIVDKDYPEKSLRWYRKDAVDDVRRNFDYLVQPGAKYFFDHEKTIQDELLEIKSLGNNDEYHLICVSKGLIEVPIADFMYWNNISFDANKYLG